MLKIPLLPAATIIANNHQMANLSKLNRFSDNNTENLEQIKKSFSGHERRKNNRELYNDISSSFSSNNVTHSLESDQTVEICGRLESLINLIRTENKGLRRELISIIDLSKNRLGKLSFELENLERECAKVKVLSAKIEELIDDYYTSEEIDKEYTTGNTGNSPRSSQNIKDSILLPDEIMNKDYDEELYGIYIEHLQEYISLLRLLTTKFWVTENKDNIIDRCYDIVGKLKSSANYMGYDKLSNYYLQWIAELEMADIDLSLAIPISFDFVDKRIKTVVGLFPEIKDIPSSDTAALRIGGKIELSEEPHAQEVEDKVQSHEESKILQEIIGSLDEIDDELECDEIIEPIKILSRAVQDQNEIANPSESYAKIVVGRKEWRKAASGNVISTSEKKEPKKPNKIIKIDKSFLGQEKEKVSFNEVLIQEFLQQLKENIYVLRELSSTFPDTQNKSQIIDQCSNLVGKLQSSANNMGYEWLEEYYLQWVAELELAGVELLMGSTVNIEFMQEKIDMIASLFLKKEKSLTLQPEPAEETHKNNVPPPDPAKVEKEIQVIKKSTEEDTEEAVLEEILILDESEVLEECIDFSYTGGVSNDSLGAGMEEPYKVSTELDVSFEPIAGRSDMGFLEKITGDSMPSLEERLFETESVELEEQSVRVDFSNVVNEKLDDLFMESEEPDEERVESSREVLGDENNFTSRNSKAFFMTVFTCLSPLSIFQRFYGGFFKRSSQPSGLRREA